MARLINNSWVAATPPSGKTITNYSLENNGVQVIEVGNVLVANGVSVGDEAINTRVRAKYNDATYGPYSNVVTIAAVSAPAAPTSLAVGTPTSTTIPLTWTKSITGVMTAYRVYDDGVLLQTFSGDVAAGTLTGLTASTTYTNLTVRAYNGTSESASSNAVNGTTAAAGATPMSFTLTNITKTDEVYQPTVTVFNGFGVSTTSFTGDFDMELEVTTGVETDQNIIFVSNTGNNAKYSDVTTAMLFGYKFNNTTAITRVTANGAATNNPLTIPTIPVYSAGNKVHLKRESGTFKLYYNTTLIHTYTETGNAAVYIHINPYTSAVPSKITNPRIQ